MCLGLTGMLQAQTNSSTDSTSTAAPRSYHWSLGLVGGMDRNYHQVNMSYMSDIKYDTYITGATFGIQATYNPWKWIGLRLDMVLIEKNYHMDHVSRMGQSVYAVTETTTENLYFNAPLMLDLSFGRRVRIHLNGGGYVGYWLSSHREGSSYSMTHMMYGTNDADYFSEDVTFSEVRDNRLDAGFVWGAGLTVDVWKGLKVGAEVRWYYGVLDIQNDYMRNLNPRYNTTMAIQGGVTWSL